MVRELVLASGMQGVKMGDLAERLGFSDTTVRKYLMKMRAAGVVERTHEGGQSCRWGPPGIFALFAGERERARQSTRERNAKRRQALATAEAAEEWAEQTPLRVMVRARDAPRLRPAGPASVWGLAA
jgi:predicted ArsR family transcriptional regulator